MDVLHLVPSYADRLYSAGHWKACQAVRLSLRDLGLEVASRVFEAEDGRDVLPALDDTVRDIVVEYSRTPELVAAIRRSCPRARIHVRAHNAEAWHHVHRSGGTLRVLARPRVFYGVCRLLERDSRCRRLGHAILSISEWDSRHYWSWLPGRARIVDVPYFSPWPDLRPEVSPWPWAKREAVMLCLPGARDAIGRAAAKGFYDLARGLSSRLAGWRFAISAGVFRSPDDEAPPPGIDHIRDLAEPWDLLCRVKAVAVLTPLGFGAKTTIFDALAAGCHVLVHPKLATHLPPAVAARCIAVEVSDSGEALATTLDSEPAPHDVNARMRGQAADGLRRVLASGERH